MRPVQNESMAKDETVSVRGRASCVCWVSSVLRAKRTSTGAPLSEDVCEASENRNDQCRSGAKGRGARVGDNGWHIGSCAGNACRGRCGDSRRSSRSRRFSDGGGVERGRNSRSVGHRRRDGGSNLKLRCDAGDKVVKVGLVSDPSTSATAPGVVKGEVATRSGIVRQLIAHCHATVLLELTDR